MLKAIVIFLIVAGCALVIIFTSSPAAKPVGTGTQVADARTDPEWQHLADNTTPSLYTRDASEQKKVAANIAHDTATKMKRYANELDSCNFVKATGYTLNSSVGVKLAGRLHFIVASDAEHSCRLRIRQGQTQVSLERVIEDPAGLTLRVNGEKGLVGEITIYTVVSQEQQNDAPNLPVGNVVLYLSQ